MANRVETAVIEAAREWRRRLRDWNTATDGNSHVAALQELASQAGLLAQAVDDYEDRVATKEQRT